MKTNFLIFMFGALVSLTFATTLSAKELVIGEAFPNISLPSLEEGEPLSISDFRGEKVLLHVWASW